MRETVLIFAGGEPVPIRLIEDLPDPDLVIAADSGYTLADSLGIGVDTLVGDMDSFVDGTALPSSVTVVKHSQDKDETDLELALELAVREQPLRTVLVGAEGGRFDHEVGAAAVISSDRWGSIPEIDWARSDALVHVVRGTRRLQGDPGQIISLIPMHGDASGVSTRGLKWSLTGETLHAGSSRGNSNRFERTEAVVSVSDGVLIAVIPYEEV